MNVLDWILITIAFVCVLRGIFRGAVSQLFGIAGVIAGIILASRFYEPLSREVGAVFPQLAGKEILCFVVLFLLTWFCVGFLGYAIGKIMRRSVIGFLDRLAGGGIGFLKAIVLSVILISVLTFFLSSHNSLLAKSILRPYVQQAAKVILQASPQTFRDSLKEKQEEIEDYWLENKGKRPKSPSPVEKTKSI